jgi:dUTP pyrophosphatase
MGGSPVDHVFVGFKKLHSDAKAPIYATAEAAGADLHAVVYPDDVGSEKGIWVLPGTTKLIRTGIAIELNPGYEAQVRPRSGLAAKHGITVLNAPGTIDSDYRGEIGVLLHNTSKLEFFVRPGDRIAQLVVAPVARAVFEEQTNAMSETVRGAGGFGSTGVSS